MSEVSAELQLTSLSEQLGTFLKSYCDCMRSFVWCRSFHYVEALSGVCKLGAGFDGAAKHGNSAGALTNYCQAHEDHLQLLRTFPRVALEQSAFHSYTFVDPYFEREQLLNSLAREFSWKKLRAINNPCANFLRYFAKRIPPNSQRALLFVDPFSMQVTWDTIQLLASSRAMDVIIILPSGISLQRIFPSELARLDAVRCATFDQFFGATDWYDVLYDSKPQERGLKSSRISSEVLVAEQVLIPPSGLRTANPGGRLVKWYRDRLSLIFAEVSKPFLVRSSAGGQLYYLLVASHRGSTVSLAQELLKSATDE